MRNAFLRSNRLTTRYFVDGNKFPQDIPGVDIFAVIKGDQRVAAISAASILAKVTRDRIMMKMHNIQPWMGYDVHKGYPTKLHLSKMKEHGVDESYRRTFGPVADLMSGSQIKEQASLF
jgi:ribonuclease HII